MRKIFTSVLHWINNYYKQLLLIALIVFFFAFPVLILFDSGHYMQYVAIFERRIPFSNWDVVRGPVFPLLIHFSNILFGKSVMGLLFFSFFFYFLMLFFSKKILDFVLKNKPKLKPIIFVLFVILVILNPIIYGYYHSLLTEFIAISISVISCFFAWNLLEAVNTEDKKKYIWLSLYFVFMFPFSWFLKQPYLSITFFPLLIVVLLSFVDLKGWEKRLKIFFVFVISLLSLLTTIFIWNKILGYKGVDMNSNRVAEKLAGFQIIGALTELETPRSFSTSIIPDEVNVLDGEGNVIDSLELEVNEEGLISTSLGVKFLFKAIRYYPGTVLKSYFNNYLVLANIYEFEKIETDLGPSFNIIERFLPNHCFQNCIIATDLIEEKSNIYYMTPELYAEVLDYEQKVNPPVVTSFVLSLNKDFSIVIINFSLFLLPIMLIITVAFYLKSIKKARILSRKILSLVIILLGYSFLHLLLHSIMGAIIDRYAIPVYLTTILGYMSFFLACFQMKK